MQREDGASWRPIRRCASAERDKRDWRDERDGPNETGSSLPTSRLSRMSRASRATLCGSGGVFQHPAKESLEMRQDQKQLS